MKIQETFREIKLSGKNTEIYLSIDRVENKMILMTHNRKLEFKFENFIEKEIIERWKEVIKLMSKAVKILEEEVKNEKEKKNKSK